MKILYVTTISNTVNAFLIPHIEMLIDEGHKVDVAFNVEQEVKPEIYDMGCKVHQLPFQRSPIKKDNFRAYKMLKDIINAEGYDLVHTHTPVASVVGRLASSKARKNGTKVIYTAHGFHFFFGAPFINWAVLYPIEKLLAWNTDTLITINKEDYNTAINKKFKLNDVILVNGVGINTDTFLPQTDSKKLLLREQYGYDKDDFILVYVGELSFRKHQDLLINAAGNLKERIPKLKILLAGSGDLLGKYKKQIEDLGVQKQVEILGFRKDIINLMNLADVAVSTSRQEGLPVNIMEAMATGLPLVVTDCRGNRDLVTDNENGYVVQIDDIEQLSSSVEKLYNSKELRKKFGEKSLGIIKKYSLENVLQEMKHVYFKCE